MTEPGPVVTREAWLLARKALLAREKAHTRERDALAAARRELPRVKVEPRYVFAEADGERSLADLFAGRRQLVVYHFMFHPDWDAGCKSCSFVADSFAGSVVHLAARDTSLVAVSRAPVAKIEAFKRRMGWSFRWLSSADTTFNYDYHVSFREDEFAAGSVDHNYARGPFPEPEAPGVSVFLRDGDDIFHTYSTYARGIDHLIDTYNYLDLTPLGRQESGPGHPMAWVRHHDSYPPT